MRNLCVSFPAGSFAFSGSLSGFHWLLHAAAAAGGVSPDCGFLGLFHAATAAGGVSPDCGFLGTLSHVSHLSSPRLAASARPSPNNPPRVFQKPHFHMENISPQITASDHQAPPCFVASENTSPRTRAPPLAHAPTSFPMIPPT